MPKLSAVMFMVTFLTCTYGILNHVRSCIVAPPCTITVTMTISDVVVNIACLASDTVLRIARANDMAPRKPVKQKNQTSKTPKLYTVITQSLKSLYTFQFH